MLILDLRRLEQAPAEVKGAISADDPVWEAGGVKLATDLAVRATAEGSSTRGVWVRGSFLGRIQTQCRRCLEPLEVEVADELAVFFDPEASAVDEDMALYALELGADELDLRPVVRERLLLAMPDYPLCGEGCRGLCPSCGTNLNESECDCAEAELDPRWAPLQKSQRKD
ncbi:MAG: DUF177 domain-containing protein [Gemmatimonadales bacterium]